MMNSASLTDTYRVLSMLGILNIMLCNIELM